MTGMSWYSVPPPGVLLYPQCDLWRAEVLISVNKAPSQPAATVAM